jgi:hypothetical protein
MGKCSGDEGGGEQKQSGGKKRRLKKKKEKTPCLLLSFAPFLLPFASQRRT